MRGYIACAARKYILPKNPYAGNTFAVSSAFPAFHRLFSGSSAARGPPEAAYLPLRMDAMIKYAHGAQLPPGNVPTPLNGLISMDGPMSRSVLQ